MRFVFVWQKVFDARAGVNLCAEIERLGHTAMCVQDVSHRNKETLSHFDVVMEVGKARDEEIPTHCTHIAWVQEYMGCGDPAYDNALGHDLIYSFGDPDVIGCPRFKQWAGSLVMAVDPSLLDMPLPTEQDIDLSLAGFIARPEWFWPMGAIDAADLKKLGEKFGVGPETTELIIRTTKIEPLAGSYDQVEAFAEYRRLLREMFKENGWETDERGWWEYDEYGARTVQQFARMVNRHAAALSMFGVSDNVVFQGLHWDLWFASHARPFTDDESQLRDLYRQSKINVHDNIFGFAMHSRVLEVMACGGFVMAHKSPHAWKAGQMAYHFNSPAHYGEYDAEDFGDVARYWLANKAVRQHSVRQARDVIRRGHLWEHRALQVLDDLGIGRAHQRAS